MQLMYAATTCFQVCCNTDAFESTEMNIIVSLLTFENIRNSSTVFNDSLMNNGINAVSILCSYFNSTKLFGGEVVRMQ